MGLVVGVDVATAQVRALVVDETGRQHAAATTDLPTPRAPHPGWCEQDAATWWPAVAEAVSAVSRRLGGAASRIVALSVCATSGSVVALDGRGEPVGPGLLYADQRAVAEAEEAQRAAAAAWSRLGLVVQPSFGLAKWAWLLRSEDVARATTRLAHVPDVVLAHLVGRPAPADWSHALKSGYDPQHERWVEPALAALGIPPNLLPEVRPPTTPVGTLTPAAARATGLPEHCEVRLGMTDGCAAQLAAGAVTPGRFVSVLGTTLVLKGVAPAPVNDPLGAVYSHRHPQGWWLPGGASNTGAAALRAGFPDRHLPELDELAARRGPARCVVFPLVGRGERFPFVAPEAERFTLGAASDEVEGYRALLEGVAFVERLGYERLARLGAAAAGPIAATGGGSASRVWNRIRASVLGVPLVQLAQATTALGACILAAAGTLHPDLASAAAAMAPHGRPVEPDERERDALEESYGRFLDAVRWRGWLQPGASEAPPAG